IHTCHTRKLLSLAQFVSETAIANNACALHGNYKEKHKSERKLNKDGEHNYSKYLVHLLLPVLKQIDREQVMEKEVEAKIQGNLHNILHN
ncbi:hypothetical protein IFM89_017290, partial [Coptis chinensis]